LDNHCGKIDAMTEAHSGDPLYLITSLYKKSSFLTVNRKIRSLAMLTVPEKSGVS